MNNNVNYHVSPSQLSGKISVPPSKSQTLRAILFGALAEGSTRIHSPLASPDTTAMLQACRQLGALISVQKDRIEIIGLKGQIDGATGPIHVGNSGIALRFLTAVAALSPTPIHITGDASICGQRPIQPLLNALNKLGAKTVSTNGFAPLTIQGPFKPGFTQVFGEDSQFVSALLIAGAICQGCLEIKVQNPGEKPWVALTLDWLKRLQIPFENRDYCHYSVLGKKSYPGFTYQVPGDFSSAAFPLIASLVTGSEIFIENLDPSDPQGDKRIIPLLQEMGADIRFEGENLVVKKGPSLKGIAIDVNACIDALPALAVVACFAEGKTHLYNAKVARTKECDRIQALATELKKMGAEIEELEDGLIIHQSRLSGATLSSHGDHRMAMALTAAALGARGDSHIENIACVAKTFPDFDAKMKQLGALIQ